MMENQKLMPYADKHISIACKLLFHSKITEDLYKMYFLEKDETDDKIIATVIKHLAHGLQQGLIDETGKLYDQQPEFDNWISEIEKPVTIKEAESTNFPWHIPKSTNSNNNQR